MSLIQQTKNGNFTVNGKEYTAAELTALLGKAEQMGRITPRVAPKGGISIYGVQAQPVTLYSEQWKRMIENLTGAPLPADSPLGKFITSNAHLLTSKSDTDAEKEAKQKARDAAGIKYSGKARK